MSKAITIKPSVEQRDELGRRVRSQTVDAGVARRPRIVLLAADGVGNCNGSRLKLVMLAFDTFADSQ